jgi:hypothetical protein
MSPDGFDNVRAMRARAAEVPPPGDGDGDDVPPDPMREEFLPGRCPVVPLGVTGDLYYYLDQLRQLRDLKAKDHSRLNIQSLFGERSSLLREFWPRRTQDKRTQEWVTTGWKPEEAAECLMAAAAQCGVWSAQERVRGAGAWTGADGELILHAGDVLLVVPPEKGEPEELQPGLRDGMVYPTAPAMHKPSPDRQPVGEKGPGARLLRLLETWNWRRKDVDAYLLLGWIGAGMLGGAIRWRPLAWITGGRGTGKSTLQDAIKWLLGPAGILQTSDATAAAVRQILRHASLPVAIDEAEAEEDGRQMAKLIKLARDAATGALAVRGGADHEATQFTIRSCFLFSSILIPPLLPQDRSRMAILELDKLGDAKLPPITPRNMGELGRRLLRRLVDEWHRWPETVDAYREAMQRAGHSARGQDVFGTLLAAADLLLHDRVPDEATLKAWEVRLSSATLSELEGDLSDEAACLNYLLSTSAEQPHDRMRMTIGRWIGRASGRFDRDLDEAGREKANRVLQEHGLKVMQFEAQQWVAVANFHRGLMRVFDGSQWAGKAGAQGVWVQALRRLPHKVPKDPQWVGALTRVTLLPLHLCLPAPGERQAPHEGSTAGPSARPDPSAGPPAGASAYLDVAGDDPLASEDGRDHRAPPPPDGY